MHQIFYKWPTKKRCKAQTPLDVLVIGGGIGGLALAQGLRKNGVAVRVIERDVTRSERLQGYRIHISPEGNESLYHCLPEHLYDAFTKTCGKSTDAFTVLNSHGETLLQLTGFTKTNEKFGHKGASRITLRQVLLSELNDIVLFNKRFSRYETTNDGRITVHCEDGSSYTADLVVGADGANSSVRKQFLPHAQRVSTGVFSVCGKVPFNEQSQLPTQLEQGPVMVLSDYGASLFTVNHQFENDHSSVGTIGITDPTHEKGLLFNNISPYTFWAYAMKKEHFIAHEDRESLYKQVIEKTTDWHPKLHNLVLETDPDTIYLLDVQTSVPIPQWETTNITLLGDSIHSMTPFRGIGANTALEDARDLVKAIVAVKHGEKELIEALHEYETTMLKRGFKRVEDSLQSCHMISNESYARSKIRNFILRTISVVIAIKKWFQL